MNLQEALTYAFKIDGVVLLDNPARLASYVRDLCDVDNDAEARVFVRACGADLLGLYVDALEDRDSAAMDHAVEHAERLLVSEHGVSPALASSVASSLCEAVLRRNGREETSDAKDSAPVAKTLTQPVASPAPTPSDTKSRTSKRPIWLLLLFAVLALAAAAVVPMVRQQDREEAAAVAEELFTLHEAGMSSRHLFDDAVTAKQRRTYLTRLPNKRTLLEAEAIKVGEKTVRVRVKTRNYGTVTYKIRVEHEGYRSWKITHVNNPLKDKRAQSQLPEATDEEAAAEEAGPVIPDWAASYQGTFGVWENGVYTSEALGLRITPTEHVTPSYESLESDSPPTWRDCYYAVKSGAFTHYFTLVVMAENEWVDPSNITFDGHHGEPVEFCGRTWWLFEYDSQITLQSSEPDGEDAVIPTHTQTYAMSCNGSLVCLNFGWMDDEAVGYLMEAMSAI